MIQKSSWKIPRPTSVPSNCRASRGVKSFPSSVPCICFTISSMVSCPLSIRFSRYEFEKSGLPSFTSNVFITYLLPDGSKQIYEVVTETELENEDGNYYPSNKIKFLKHDWENRVIGDQGWYLSATGNAIFNNVAVRGEITATTLDVGGINGIVYDGNDITIGSDVTINAALTVNSLTVGPVGNQVKISENVSGTNDGILITPFHNMALVSPVTTEGDIEKHTKAFRAMCKELVSA